MPPANIVAIVGLGITICTSLIQLGIIYGSLKQVQAQVFELKMLVAELQKELTNARITIGRLEEHI